MGDVNYSDPTHIEDNFTTFWNGYLNNMYVSLGNHDLMYDYGESVINSLPSMKNLIGTTNITNKYYFYDFVKGPIHFFVLNSGDGFDDLNESDDPNMNITQQLIDLQEKVPLSTSPWNIVVVHRPPYTNESLHGPGSPLLRLDYKSLGVQAILSGHAHIYEYIYIDDVAYIVQGLGGATKRCSVPPLVTGTETTYCAKNGYTICEATDLTLTFKTYSIDDELIDIKTLIK